MARTPAWGAGGREFESPRPDVVREWIRMKFRMPQPEWPDYLCWGIIIVLLVIIHMAAT